MKKFSAKPSDEDKVGEEMKNVAAYAKDNGLRWDHDGMAMKLCARDGTAVNIAYEMDGNKLSVVAVFEGNQDTIGKHYGKLVDIYKQHGFQITG